MRKYASSFILTLALALFFLVPGCATIENATGTRTYVASQAQLEAIRKELNIVPCPDGTTALAMTIESAAGGAIITVRCS
jgi:hypothetical protein